jgi:hypothetical protein
MCASISTIISCMHGTELTRTQIGNGGGSGT